MVGGGHSVAYPFRYVTALFLVTLSVVPWGLALMRYLRVSGCQFEVAGGMVEIRNTGLERTVVVRW